MNTFSPITPTFVEHEGFTFLEFNGEFYKGCKRCGGEGHYSHNGEHSRCYECDNTSAKLGEHFANREAAEKWCHGRALAHAARIRKAEREVAARIAKMEAKQEALKASDPEVYAFLLAVDDNDGEYSEDGSRWIENRNRERSSFILDMHRNLVWPANCDKSFTEKMVSEST